MLCSLVQGNKACHCGRRALQISPNLFAGFCRKIHSKSLWKSCKISNFRGLFFTGLDPVSGTFRRVVSRSFGAKSTFKPTETKITICALTRQPLGNSVNSPSLWVKIRGLFRWISGKTLSSSHGVHLIRGTCLNAFFTYRHSGLNYNLTPATMDYVSIWFPWHILSCVNIWSWWPELRTLSQAPGREDEKVHSPYLLVKPIFHALYLGYVFTLLGENYLHLKPEWNSRSSQPSQKCREWLGEK
jgi:hypothetical protein